MDGAATLRAAIAAVEAEAGQERPTHAPDGQELIWMTRDEVRQLQQPEMEPCGWVCPDCHAAARGEWGGPHYPPDITINAMCQQTPIQVFRKKEPQNG